MNQPEALSASEQADEQLARAAIEKRRLGQVPPKKELKALERVQERTLMRQLSAIRPVLFRKLTGMQTKQLHDWEDKYNIPCGRGREEISLFRVFDALRKLIADNKLSINAEGVSKAEAQKTKLEKEIEKLEEQIRKLQNENEHSERQLVSKDLIVSRHERMAMVLRTVGENLGRKSNIKGSDAQAMLNAALANYEREIEGVKKIK